ncbi:hypothetical protein [Actinoallomurus sp. NPDC050550]|uniref:hypothetical protein n=1 Tax=Actinoallomurus sp. NPDC050550 TaxID=3154937 RepID=UPI0033E0CF32
MTRVGAGRGGRRASLPDAQWRAPEALIDDGLAVRFVEEGTGEERNFDFSDVPVSPQLQPWLAQIFLRRISPPKSVKKIESAKDFAWYARRFGEVLSQQMPAPTAVNDVTAGHIEAFSAKYAGLRSHRHYVDVLRGLLRDAPELSAEVRRAVVTGRPGPGPGLRVVQADDPAGGTEDEETPAEYTGIEWQQIMTVLRRDIRQARDRIRAGRTLLARFRAGELAAGSHEELVGRHLDVFERTGDFPRAPNGVPNTTTTRAGGVWQLSRQLCLTIPELGAFALLLTALTGENLGTVAAWPAVTYRPDGGRQDLPAVALLEASKPRRGPDREHMITALEDIPSTLASVLAEGEDERRLFRSPLKVYLLLIELTELTRRHGGHTGAFSAYTPAPGKKQHRWVSPARNFHLHKWAEQNGFGRQTGGDGELLPLIEVRRVRNTVIERRRRPIAHSRRTMNDQYLKRSEHVIRESRAVVAEALRGEVDKARARQSVQVFTTAFIERARRAPEMAAAEAGVDVDTLHRLLSGENDTVLAGCVDHLAGIHSDPGLPCPASFLDCLTCVNARALPHQLPVQLLAQDQIAGLRPHLDPRVWQTRWADTLSRLRDLTGPHHYTDAERADARSRIEDRHHAMVDDLLQGRLELR